MNEFTFDMLFDKYKPMGRREEIHQLVNLVEWFSPHVVLELGVCQGGTLGFWEHLLPVDGLLVGADRLNVVQWDWRSSPKNVDYVQCDLDDPLSYVGIAEALGNEFVDFLYIDADHYYDGVKGHFELYAPLVRKGGIIAFHDIRDNKGSGYGVGKFFNELKERYGWLEILVPGEDRGPGADGIGVIFQ